MAHEHKGTEFDQAISGMHHWTREKGYHAVDEPVVVPPTGRLNQFGEWVLDEEPKKEEA